MTFRFLHASDLHLGKPFGGYPEGIRNRLREARHAAIGRLAQAARQGGAQVVLLAGDSFDAETPAPDTLRQALRAMAEEADIRWIMLPGNHDSLAATELWRRIATDGPANLKPLLDDSPVTLADDVWLLPAPCTQRRAGRDLTQAMDAATPQGARRIGLGHGPVTDFDEGDGRTGIIPPDRAARSGLDYLALGDWHGQRQIGPATWYSGAPEADSFKHDGPAGALLVELGVQVTARAVPVGQFRWTRPHLDLLPGADVRAALTRALPTERARDHLVSVTAGGRLALSDRAALDAALQAAAPDYGWFAADLSALQVKARPDDLDLIDRAGALRHAADALLADTTDPQRSQADRDISAAALSRLYSFAQEVQA